jgi:uncharacterized protein YqeY
MLRNDLADALKTAQKAKQALRVSTLRLITAAIKDRDIAIRSDGRDEGVSDDEILAILQKMIKQRNESISHYETGGRVELAAREQEEIEVIREFLPAQMSADDLAQAAKDIVNELGAVGLKDMGRTMAVLKERYAGRMDFSAASAIVKQLLSS